MGIFFDVSEARELEKDYTVYKARPKMHYFFIVVMVIMVLPMLYYQVTDTFLPFFSLEVMWATMALFTILLFIRLVEGRKIMYAGYQHRQVIKKGKNTTSFKHPAEMWIEKK
ncbi:hypothetical protein GOV09_03005 [Candidatus Woesearchaeota archaeon]|nr:hypothetical protein [Candidatus Woesearchaeota archaeon]